MGIPFDNQGFCTGITKLESSQMMSCDGGTDWYDLMGSCRGDCMICCVSRLFADKVRDGLDLERGFIGARGIKRGIVCELGYERVFKLFELRSLMF